MASILAPTFSLNSASISFRMTRTILPKPALAASRTENSRIDSPLGPIPSACFNPPYRDPIPAASISKVGCMKSYVSDNYAKVTQWRA